MFISKFYERIEKLSESLPSVEECIASALQRDVHAEYRLGVLYSDRARYRSKAQHSDFLIGFVKPGDTPPLRNDQIALYWYSRAAAQGDGRAVFKMGECYEFGWCTGVDKDDTQAVRWYDRAAKIGYQSAQLRLAQCYEEGIGIDKNLNHALYWYQQASRQDEKAKESIQKLTAQNIIPSDMKDIPKLFIPDEKRKLDNTILSYKELAFKDLDKFGYCKKVVTSSSNSSMSSTFTSSLPGLNCYSEIKEKKSGSSASYCVNTAQRNPQVIYSPPGAKFSRRRTLFFKPATTTTQHGHKYQNQQNELMLMKRQPDKFPILIFNSTMEMLEISELFAQIRKSPIKLPIISKQQIEHYFEESFLKMIRKYHREGSIFIISKSAISESAISLLIQKLIQDKWYTSLIFYNSLSTGVILRLAKVLRQNTQLRELIIGSNYQFTEYFTDTEARFLVEALETNTTLTNLSIAGDLWCVNNRIKSALLQRLRKNKEREQKKELPKNYSTTFDKESKYDEVKKNLTNVWETSTTLAGIADEIDPSLKKFLDYYQDSSQIDLKNKINIGNREVFFIIDYLSSNIQFPVSLDLSDNFISDAGAIALAEFLEKSSHIKELYLRDNVISDVGIQILIQILTKNKSLVTLDICDNMMKLDHSSAVLAALQSNRTLKHIYLEKHIPSLSMLQKMHIELGQVVSTYSKILTWEHIKELLAKRNQEERENTLEVGVPALESLTVSDKKSDEAIFKKMAHEFESNLKNCNISLPLCFYLDPIPVAEFKNSAGTPLFIDLHRNRKAGERLFLLAGEIISEELGDEAKELQHLINKKTLEKKQSLSDQKESIQHIDSKLFQTVDKWLTTMLLNKNLKISLLAEKLGMSTAKDAIRCFHQNILYLNHYLVMYALYLFNTPLVLPNMAIINIGKQKNELLFTAYSKGFSCKTEGIGADGNPAFVDNGQLSDVEIAVKFNLIRKGDKLKLMPKAYTSDIKLAKTLFQIFCANQLKKYVPQNHESEEPDSPREGTLCHFFGSAQPSLASEKKPALTSPFILEGFLKIVYTEMALALPSSLNFSEHLKMMASLSHSTESADKYLAALYLEIHRLSFDVVETKLIMLPNNLEKIAKTTIFDLYIAFIRLIKSNLQNSLNCFIWIPECIWNTIYQYADFTPTSEREKLNEGDAKSVRTFQKEQVQRLHAELFPTPKTKIKTRTETADQTTHNLSSA